MVATTGQVSKQRPGSDRDGDLEANVARGHVMAALFGDKREFRRLGRYHLRQLLGRGAHGQVFEAFDPELDRLVAIKVVRNDDDDDEEQRRRRVREARVLAQLDHPHVVDVYDVGVEDGRAFVVMELVDGEDLGRFLDSTKPTLSDLVALFVAAGRGLAAAHEVGLMHRDFKPSNVLVGASGVKVADFGLARAIRAPTLDGSGADTLDHAGTPIYMPPEQFRGEALSAASDQYAFCVALWEAVGGELPFDGANPLALLAAKENGPPSSSPPRMPRALGAVLRRGLAADATQRHASMDALLSEVERSVRPPSRRRTFGLLAAAALVAVGGLSAVSAASPPVCDLATLAQWNGPLPAALRQRLSETSLPADEVTQIADDVQAYAERWDAARDSACAAEPGAHQAIAACLDTAAVELQATLTGLVGGEAELVSHTGPAIHDLPDPEACLASTTTQPSRSANATAVARSLARCRAWHRLGQPKRALVEAEAAFAGATDLDAARQAEASWELGRAYAVVGRDAEAAERLAAAFYTARSAARPRLAVQAAAMLADFGLGKNDQEEAEQWLRHADAVLGSTAGDPILRGTVLHGWANLHMVAGRLGDAREALDEALSLSDGDGFEAAPLYFTRAQINQRLGELETAETDLRRALTIEIDRLGVGHPELISSHAMLGMVLLQLERLEAATVEVEAAMELGHRWLPPESADMARLHESAGAVALARGEPGEALQQHGRALEIRRTVYPEEHPAIAFALHNVGLAAEASGHFADAVAAHREAMPRFEELFERGDPQLDEVYGAFAAALRGAGYDTEADSILRRVGKPGESE